MYNKLLKRLINDGGAVAVILEQFRQGRNATKKKNKMKKKTIILLPIVISRIKNYI